MPKAIGPAIAVLAVLLMSDGARAAGADACGAYAREAVAKAHGVKDLACGYDLTDARWATDLKRHTQWCRTTPKDAVAKETAQRREQMTLCRTCRVYADLAAGSAANNTALKCGLTGPRWNTDSAAHFAWCMAQSGNGAAPSAQATASDDASGAGISRTMQSETGRRLLAIEVCKKRQSNLHVPPARRIAFAGPALAAALVPIRD